MKRRANPPNRRRNLVTSASIQVRVLLTAVSPPKCCLQTNEYETLCLSGMINDEMTPDVMSLSVLVKQDGEWCQVSLFGSTTVLQEQGSSLALVARVEGLEERLRSTVSLKECGTSQPSTIQDFLKKSELIFREFLACVVHHEHAKVESSPPSWTVEYALELVKQLEEVERVYGSDVVQELSTDLMKLTLQCKDQAGRIHLLRLSMSADKFPQSCPKCETDLPTKSEWQPSWCVPTMTSEKIGKHESTAPCKRLKVEKDNEKMDIATDTKDPSGFVGLYADFTRAVSKYQDVWNELDDLDTSTWVLEPAIQPPCRSNTERRIAVSDDVSLILRLDPGRPRTPPHSIRWIGTDTSEHRLKLDRYTASKDLHSGWSEQLPLRENLERALGISLPTPPSAKGASSGEVALECSICYTHNLPSADSSATEFPDALCDNAPCGRNYHESCLREWLHSLPSSRKSFDRIIGTCPYCSEPISATMEQR